MRDIEKLPGNARIAVALLDVLATAGDVAGRERAERALLTRTTRHEFTDAEWDALVRELTE